MEMNGIWVSLQEQSKTQMQQQDDQTTLKASKTIGPAYMLFSNMVASAV